MAKVLVAVDHEGLVAAALPLLRTLLQGSTDQVLLLHVAGRHATRAEADEVLRRLERDLEPARARVRSEVRPAAGGVAGTLVAAARSWEADLVVLGSHGRGRVTAAVVGSVSHAVAAGVDCRVLVVHVPAETAGEAPLRRVLLAVDRDVESGGGVRLAAELALRHGAAVTVFHARPVDREAEAVTVERREDAWWAVGRARLQLKLEGVRANGLIGVAWRGVPAAIAAAADGEDADLIILDSRRPGDWLAIVAPSTAHGVLSTTTRPVLLADRRVRVKEPAAAESATGRREALLPA